MENGDNHVNSVNATSKTLSPGGQYRFRKEGEEHLWQPLRVVDFREAVRNDDFARFKRYTDDIDQNSHVTLRSQLEFVGEKNRLTGLTGFTGLGFLDEVLLSLLGVLESWRVVAW